MFWKNCGKAALMLSCRDYSTGQPVQVGVVQSRLNHGITQQPKKKKNGSDKKYNKRNCLSYSISYHKVSVIKYLKHFHIQLLYSIQLLYLLFSSSIFCVYYVEIEHQLYSQLCSWNDGDTSEYDGETLLLLLFGEKPFCLTIN